MCFEEHLEFLQRYSKVMRLAVDELDPEDVAAVHAFFEDVYTPFTPEDEQAVACAVRDANRFMLVAAPPGGGKSTILHWGLQHEAIDRRNYFLFDFKEQINSFATMSSDDREKVSFIHDRFKNALLQQQINNKEEALDFTLKALQLFFRLKWIALQLRCNQVPSKSDAEDDYKSVKAHFLSDTATAAEWLEFVTRELTCAQTIMTIQAAFTLPKFLVVIDNVDRFSVADQPVLFSVAIDIQREGRGRFGTLVAVRNKNLLRFEEAGAGGDLLQIVFLSPGGEERMQPHNLRAPTSEFALALLQRRQGLLRREVVHSANVKLVRSLELFGLIQMHVNRGLTEERLYELANHSYRRMFGLHTNFVRYLFRLACRHKGTFSERELVDWRVNSYLYRFMYAAHNDNHEFLRDIVGKYKLYRKRTSELPLACDIDLVVLAWLASNSHHLVKVRDLIKAAEPLAIGEKEILDWLQELYVPNLDHRYVEFGDSERRLSASELRSENCLLRISPLGLEFVHNTITKFEFLHQCLAFPEVVDVDAPEMLESLETDAERKIGRVYSFLEQMKAVHQETLNQFRDSWQNSTTDWEDYYRDTFCIKRELILERVMRSHLSYIRHVFPVAYPRWRTEYTSLMADYLDKVDSRRKVGAVFHGL